LADQPHTTLVRLYINTSKRSVSAHKCIMYLLPSEYIGNVRTTRDYALRMHRYNLPPHVRAQPRDVTRLTILKSCLHLVVFTHYYLPFSSCLAQVFFQGGDPIIIRPSISPGASPEEMPSAIHSMSHNRTSSYLPTSQSTSPTTYDLETYHPPQYEAKQPPPPSHSSSRV
jgi:hypothetical protein